MLSNIAHFEILGELGAGGMGVVYRARDTRLNRDVAIKALPDDVPRGSARFARFEREAQVLASLSHPRIGAIHGLEDVGGQIYLILEHIPGESLAERIARGPLARAEALEIASQIAEALTAAHGRDIIHRDLKPSNVMLTPDDQVKVVDFGLARRLELDAPEKAPSQARTRTALTTIGAVLGTAPYSSPEQIRGQALDRRTDIWSFGCVLYEMVTGRPAFRKATRADTTNAILEHDPDWSVLPSGLGPQLEGLLGRCLEKTLDRRPTDFGEIRSEIEQIQRGEGDQEAGRKGWPPGRRAVAGLAAALIVLAALTLGTRAFEGLRRRFLGRPPAAATQAAVRSLAVLPLANLSGDPEREYFADGMTEALVAQLSTIDSLRVISRTSVMRYKATRKPISEIARELNVDAIVEGAVREGEGRVTVSARLIHAATDTSLWSGSYERMLRDVLALQIDVTRSIAAGIQVELTADQQLDPTASEPVVPEAHDAYLRGIYFLDLRTPEGFRKAPEYFNRAIALDPGFAPPYAGLAALYNALGSTFAMPPRQAASQAKTYASKALALDPSLAEAHAAMGVAASNEWRWDEAESSFLRAIELQDSYSAARQWYGLLLIYIGRSAEGLEQLRAALALDPFSLRADSSYGLGLYFARDYAAALDQFDKAIELHPQYPLAHLFRGLCLLAQGQHGEAFEGIDKAIEQGGRWPPMLSVLGFANGAVGRKEQALAILDELEAMSERAYVPADFIAAIYIGIGQSDLAFDWLERAFGEGSAGMIYLRVSPVYDGLRDDPRFQDLISRVGLAG